MPFVKTIAELDRTDLPSAGGKGANLGALTRAGLPVPGGFVVTTEGYHAFVAANNLEVDLRRILPSIQMDDPTALAFGSDQIRNCFCAGQLPPLLAHEIRQAYRALSQQPVAIRSSATAEDLPDLSFAGQQDTYLNILGEEAVLNAVMRCWASLWTARAIGYRARNAIPHDNIALAVVVQQMVQSEASGVLFTANPLTGNRTETVIDATIGLGEALVAGQVEPDHYVVESASGRILSKRLGAKALVIQGQVSGGTVMVAQEGSQQQALADEQIVALTQLGKQAASHFGTPQDLEWAFANRQLSVVQSRPITSLYPLPANVAGQPLEVLLSFGVWQGMLDPYTPLGQEMIAGIVSGVALLFGQKIKPEEQRVFLRAGERLFVNITGLLKTRVGRAGLAGFLSAIDATSSAIVSKLLQEITLPAPAPINLRTKLRLAIKLLPLPYTILFNLLAPARGRARLERKIEQELARAQSAFQAATTLSELIDEIASTPVQLPKALMPYLVGGVISGQMPLQLLIRLAADLPGGADLALELTRGLPHNVTTEMDLALWQTAQTIRAEVSTATYFNETEMPTLIAAYRHGRLPASIQTAIANFMTKYGARGVGEIDLGRTRWQDDPTYLFQMLKNYLPIDPQNAPAATFRRSAEKAQLAQEQLIATVLQLHGKFRAKMVKVMAMRVRGLGGLRETPKFAIVRLFGHIRAALLRASQKLVDRGVLTNADDIFFLDVAELRALAHGEAGHWHTLIAERRATYQREMRRKRLPRVLLSDGRAFYHAPSSAAPDEANTLRGNPVSPGLVEGIVHVVLNPQGIQLAAGEILVCPATDPAWTPLFLTAGGLVMEVGGMMTHGSVVAREYGIPAVVGVQQVTERLKSGQRVRVDGSSGQVTILNELIG